MEKIFAVGIHQDWFRPGEPAEITGVRMVTPKGKEPRPCFVVRFKDGTQDELSIFQHSGNKDVRNTEFDIVTESDVLAGLIPAVR
ncbi:MAG: hypothetical protein ABH884_03380 [Candidatus Komeilibacteria bacterium]